MLVLLVLLRTVSYCCLRNNEQEMTFLVIDGTRQWPNTLNVFFKKTVK